MYASPKITVIMPEYNTNVEDLRLAIKSILDQSFTDFELIIIDDASNNDIKQITDGFDDARIRVVVNKSNRGSAYSRNKGIMEARGVFIALMDSDDISSPQRIEKLYKYLLNHPEVDVVGSRAVEFSGISEYGVIGQAGQKTKKSLIKGDVINHGSAIIRKSALTSVRYSDEFRRAQDYVLWCDLVLQGSHLQVVDEVLYRYRVNPEDYSKRKLSNRKYEIKARVMYYPKLGASVLDYRFILKSIVAGLLPAKLSRAYRNTFVLTNSRIRSGTEYK